MRLPNTGLDQISRLGSDDARLARPCSRKNKCCVLINDNGKALFWGQRLALDRIKKILPAI